MKGDKGNVSLLGTKEMLFDQRVQFGCRVISDKMNMILF